MYDIGEKGEYPSDENHRIIMEKLKAYVKRFYDETKNTPGKWIIPNHLPDNVRRLASGGNGTHLSVIVNEKGNFVDMYTVVCTCDVYYSGSIVNDIKTPFNLSYVIID